ncbi:ribonuclease HIII [Bacillus massiliglaciei]|uniref:ribonuclease HIII n=1 Tax=Bacillus massiliglaciei TaxID=1816693 RepID=UPI000AD83716|nr:ribonuclease HIII [Bacillus massiliglaciei]
MSHVVLQVPSAAVQEMKKHYQPFLSEKVPQGGIFAAKPPLCSITAYKSGKVLFQGKNAEAEAGKWGKSASAVPAKTAGKSVKTHSFSPPPEIGTMSVAGSDEVGTGDYFGPITVVAAYVKKEQLALLKELGVKDSKNLKDPQIMEIARQIKSIIPFSLLICDNPKYNSLQQKGMSQGKIKALLHNQALKHLLQKIEPEQPEAILIDQFAQPDVFFNYLKGQTLFQANATYLSTKAEGIHLSVAAASILARYAFIQRFDLLSEKAGFRIPKGAGSLVDEAAARLIAKKGFNALNEFTKLHFANTEKAKRLYERKYGK